MGLTLFGESGSALVCISTVGNLGKELVIQGPSCFDATFDYFTEHPLGSSNR